MPVVVVSGRHGKTAVVRGIGALLGSKGLSVGTFTSPHLSRVNERLAVGGEVIGDAELAGVISDLAGVEPLFAQLASTRAELLSAVALRWFSDVPAHAAVLEAGSESFDPLGGLGAVEEVAVGLGVVCASEVEASEVEAIEGESAPERWVPGVDFGCSRNRLAVGGRSVDMWTPTASYEGVWIGVHGRHQVANFAVAVAASECFFGAPIEEERLREAAAALRLPGQLEVVGHRPAVVVDTATDVIAATCVAEAFDEEFAACRGRIVVVALRDDTDPTEMLSALGVGRARLVVACEADAAGTRSAGEVALEARRFGVEVVERGSVVEGVRAALEAADPDDLVGIVGPPSMVGSARVAMGVPATRATLRPPWTEPSS
jgi:dihydrofolate synthase/folylpolyglutamate synthase